MRGEEVATNLRTPGWPLPAPPVWIVGGLVFLALLTASRIYLSLALKAVAEPFSEILLGEGLKWALWIPAIPAIVALDRRLGFGRSWVAAALAAHLGLAALILAVHTVIMTAAGQSAGWYFALETARATAMIRIVHEGTTVFLVYGAVVALDHVRRNRREREESRLSESRLEAQLATERLHNLQSRLRPHFLFNALHAVAGLLRDGERERAVETVLELSDLLRMSLRRADRQLVRLSDELDFLERYLAIQEARYGDQLQVEWRIEPDATDAAVPHLLLQPLVENAMRHGVEQALSTGDEGAHIGRIEIAARRSERRLHLVVADNGPGPGPRDRRTDGVGLPNTRARLETLFGDDFTLEVAGRPDSEGGTRARVEIPYLTAENTE